jgi:CheY-like chemotaxis protein
MAPVEVNRVISQLRDILHHTIGPDIAISTRLGEFGEVAQCDENQLENAILNLAINARDAMPEGGRLIISTDLCQIEGETDVSDGSFVRITVDDSGEGMTPDVLARATEPFFSTKPLGKGTGLGLAQVYGIARQSGGTLRIESRPGEGTKVSILLPTAQVGPADSEIVVPAVNEPRTKRARVFLVDDDPDVRSFLADLLDELGHEVLAFAGGADALASLDGCVPDLLLIDFAMPGMNGAQLAAEVKARHPGLPFAFITGFAESDQLDAATAAGAPVLRKPFGMDELARILASLLGGGPLEPPQS